MSRSNRVTPTGGHHAAGELEVRHVHPYEAVKTYRCPGCDQEIPPGLGHEVVVPLDSPRERRHWHTSCWRRAEPRHR